MKRPAIIDSTDKVTICCYAMLIPPHKEEDFDRNDETEVLFARAMDLISDGQAIEGKKYLEQSYQMGNLRAGRTLSYGYASGWFGERDYKTQLAILWNMVKKGHPGAMSDIGYAYHKGDGLRKSMRWALYWYEKSANASCPEAMSNLAHIYLFGYEKYRNIKKGVYHAFMAADLGSEMAMNALGLCYKYGIGLSINYTNAFKWFSNAVENGAGAPAEHNLALCYRKGIGTPINKDKAKELEDLAAVHGYPQKEE